MVYILITGCFIILLLSFFCLNRSIINPSFLITLGFFFSSLNLLTNQSLWNFNSILTVLLILCGLIAFFLGCIIVKISFKNRNFAETARIDFNSFELRFGLYAVFQSVLYLFILIWIIKSQGQGISLSGVSAALSSFHQNNLLGLTELPNILNILNILNLSGVYLLFYIFISFRVKKVKVPKIINVNCVIALIGSLFTGNRTVFSMYIVALLVLYFLIEEKVKKTFDTLNARSLILAVFSIFFISFCFILIASFQGRTQTNVDTIYSFSTYLGGPLKNLEIFVNNNVMYRQIFGGQTFMNTYTWLSTSFGIPSFKIINLYRYNFLPGNIGLGNVYSILMPLYNDFGFLGTMVAMFLLGLFSQYIYYNALFKKAHFQISYYTIFYSYLSFALVMSFFSNKMGESIFSRAGIYFIVGIWIFDLLLCRPILKKEI